MKDSGLKLFAALGICILFTSWVGCVDQKEIAVCEFPDNLDAYDLVWADEFEGTTIDESKWSFQIGNGCDISENLCGWGNNELQWYTDRKENAFISNGNLVIRARKEIPFYLGQHQYTSARIITKNKGDWRYGRMEVRAKTPRGRGLWPAIWMLSTDEAYGTWPRSGEIDIMELRGHRPESMFSTIHYGHDYWRFLSGRTDLESGDFSQDFHVFAVQWKENCMQFFVDGKQVRDFELDLTQQIIAESSITPSATLPTTWPFQERFHMLLNVAVGGNFPGNPDASTLFPQEMKVDYVRVYQEK